MSKPVSGNLNDLYDIEVHFEEVTATLEEATISLDGLFLNADTTEKLRVKCESKGIITNIAQKKSNYSNLSLWAERTSLPFDGKRETKAVICLPSFMIH